VSESVLSALVDDLNTPQAIVELHRLAGEARKGDFDAACDLHVTCKFLGLALADVDLQEIAKRQRGGVDEARINALVDARNAARTARNFGAADRIRDELKAMGVELEDKKDGTTAWKVKP
jgi:cysteinyl-tRNA synthetase